MPSTSVQLSVTGMLLSVPISCCHSHVLLLLLGDFVWLSRLQLRSPCLCLAEPAATSACERGISLQRDSVFIQIWLQELLIYVARL